MKQVTHPNTDKITHTIERIRENLYRYSWQWGKLWRLAPEKCWYVEVQKCFKMFLLKTWMCL